MSGTTLMILLAVVILIVLAAFVILTIRMPSAGTTSLKKILDNKLKEKKTTSDFRSKKIKCIRCGADAYGMLGTKNIYRCQSCGFKT